MTVSTGFPWKKPVVKLDRLLFFSLPTNETLVSKVTNETLVSKVGEIE